MSGYQLGRVGLVLLALHLAVQSLSGVISSLATSSRGAAVVLDPEWVAISVAIAVVVVLIAGAIPAAILIANREALSRRWFGGNAEPQESIASGDLFRVGLVLLAVAGIWEGAVGLGSAGMLSASLRSGSESQLERGTGTVDGLLFRSAANLAVGALLIWVSKPLSKRWF
jgi:hypothetical protein